MKSFNQKSKLTVTISIAFVLALLPVLNSQAMVNDSQEAVSQEAVVSSGLQQPILPQQPKAPEFTPGELIVKLKEGKSLGDIQELNAQYNVTSSEEVFKDISSPEDILKQLKGQLAKLGSEHDSWFWQLDKGSKEYKDYVARINKEKEILQTQIQAQEELLSHLEQRQKRAPEDVTPPDLSNTYVLSAAKETDILVMAAEYAKDASVAYAEPNYVCKVQQSAPIIGPPPIPSWPYTLPNDSYVDPNHTNTWTKGAWGQAYEDMWGLKKIQANRAWPLSLGKGVVVAVIDTGIDYTHEDFSSGNSSNDSLVYNNIWINTREFPNNGKDDDGNGYIDDIRGWNFVSNTNDPKDGYGHGTHCAGTIAAVGNNYKGIIGVAPNAKLMAVKGLGDTGSGLDADLAKCIYYAANNGADILSNSWGGSGSSQVITDAVNYAYSKGCVIVAAAGNNSTDAKYFFPANIDNVIAVAATGQNDKLCLFSNWGEKIDVTAPGGDDTPTSIFSNFDNVLSLLAPNSYLAKNYAADIVGLRYLRLAGTSMACPHVAGLAALIASKYPNDTNKNIKARMIIGAEPLLQEPMYAQGYLGSGRINTYNALTLTMKPYIKVKEAYLRESQGDGDQIPEAGEKINLIVKLENIGKAAVSVIGSNLISADVSSASVIKSYAHFGSIAQGQIKENGNDPFILQGGNINFETPVKVSMIVNADGYAQELNVALTLGIKRLPIDMSSYRVNRYCLDDNKIVFDDILGNYYIEKGEIYLYDLTANRVRRLTKDDGNIKAYPAMSGNKVVWLERGSGAFNWGVYVYDINTNTGKMISRDASNHRDPFIYKNKVVWSDDRNGNNDIYLYDLDKNEERRITSNTAGQISPKIYGNKIIWIDFRNGRYDYDYYDIYLYDLDKNQEIKIPRQHTASRSVWPIDIYGNKIVWADDAGVYLYDLDKNEEKYISSHDYRNWYITSLKIFGNNIVWDDSDGGKSPDIYLYDLKKNQKTAVTSNLSTQYVPYISGRKIVWFDYRDDFFHAQMYLAEIPDTTPPTGSIRITSVIPVNRSARIAILSLSAQDTESGMGAGAQMQFSHDGKNWFNPEAYITRKIWMLTPGTGIKVVFVRFKDVAGNWSAVYSASTIVR